jgi:hypothetical protein
MILLKRIFILLSFLPLLTSCFDLREDINLRKDGSGTYALLLDMSRSREMINFAKQSANEAGENDEAGFSIADSGFVQLANSLGQLPGISDAKNVKDDVDFIYGITFKFNNLQALNNALLEISQSSDRERLTTNFYSADKKTFTKADIFYLKAFAEPLLGEGEKSDEENRNIGMLTGNSLYVFNFTTEGKIKSVTEPAVKVGENSARVSVSLTELYAKGINSGTIIKLK